MRNSSTITATFIAFGFFISACGGSHDRAPLLSLDKWSCSISQQKCKTPGQETSGGTTCAEWDTSTVESLEMCFSSATTPTQADCQKFFCDSCRTPDCQGCVATAAPTRVNSGGCSSGTSGTVGGGTSGGSVSGPSASIPRYDSGKYRIVKVPLRAQTTPPGEPPRIFDSSALEGNYHVDDLVGVDSDLEKIWYATSDRNLHDIDFSTNAAGVVGDYDGTALATEKFSAFALVNSTRGVVAEGNSYTLFGVPSLNVFETTPSPGEVVDLLTVFGSTDGVTPVTTAPSFVGAARVDGLAAAAISETGTFWVANRDDSGATTAVFHSPSGDVEFPNATGVSVAANDKFWVLGLTNSGGTGEVRVFDAATGAEKYTQPVGGTPENLLLFGSLLFVVTRSGSLVIEPYDVENPTPITMLPVATYSLLTNGKVLRTTLPIARTSDSFDTAFLWITVGE